MSVNLLIKKEHTDTTIFNHPRLFIDSIPEAEEYFRRIHKSTLRSFLSELISSRKCLVNCTEELEGNLTEVEERSLQDLFLLIGMNWVKVINKPNISKAEITNINYGANH